MKEADSSFDAKATKNENNEQIGCCHFGLIEYQIQTNR